MAQEAQRRRRAQNTIIEFLVAHPRVTVTLVAVGLVFATASLTLAAEGLTTGFETAPDMGGSTYETGPGTSDEPSRDGAGPEIRW